MGKILLLFFGFFISFTLMPAVIRIGTMFILDKPNNRKIHKTAKPRSGGIAIYLSFLVTNFIFIVVPLNVAIPITLVFILGILDDIYSLKANHKLICQIFIGLITFYLGFELNYIALGNTTIYLSYIYSMIFTVLWITAIMNAVNLIDGLDGLSSLLSIIALTMLALVTIIFRSSLQGLILIYLGATIAFYIFNKHPSKLFLGDCGSLQLGYIISLASLDIIGQNSNVQTMGFIFLVFIPIFDTGCAIIRRSLNKKPIFSPDCKHIHHKLLAQNVSPCNSCYILGALSLIAAVAGVTTLIVSSLFITIIMAIFMLALSYVAYTPEKVILPIYYKVSVKEVATTIEKANATD
ncbi:MraY family glycosyltransferase [Proteinivorax tanatarense]|uniref:MraY family glycosyltransferase n=1 Tax=Proteinivorax tanatarense TaxID=1260629 RepID=A0AAU7VI14_9FIRM